MGHFEWAIPLGLKFALLVGVANDHHVLGVDVFRRTLLSLQALFSLWYLSRFSGACNLLFYAVSSSTYLYIGVVATISV